MYSNGYLFNINTETKTVDISEVLTKNLNKFQELAKREIYKAFNRPGDAEDLIMDLWLSFKHKSSMANQSGFAFNEEEANKIIGRSVCMYAKNARYVPGLEDLNKAKTSEDDEITICSFSAVEETLESIEETTTNVSMDVIYANDFISRWDAMNDEDELTTNQRMEVVSELAKLYKNCKTAAERKAIENTARLYLNLDADTPDEYKNALYVRARQL